MLQVIYTNLVISLKHWLTVRNGDLLSFPQDPHNYTSLISHKILVYYNSTMNPGDCEFSLFKGRS